MLKISRKALSILLSLCMLISMVPLTSIPSFAASDSQAAVTAEDTDDADDSTATLSSIGIDNGSQFQVKIQYTDETVVADTWTWDAANDCYVPANADGSEFFGQTPLLYSRSCISSNMTAGNRYAYYNVLYGYADVAKMMSAYGVNYDHLTNIMLGTKGDLNLKDYLYGYSFLDPYTDYEAYRKIQNITDGTNPYQEGNLTADVPSLAYVFAASSEKVYSASMNENSSDPLAEYLKSTISDGDINGQNTMISGRNSNGEYGYTGWYGESERSITFVMDTEKPAETSGYQITTNVVTSSGSSAGGTLSAASSAEAGETVSVTATPGDDYYLAQLKAGDTVIDIRHNGNSDGTGGTFTFTMPSNDVTLEATFVTKKWDGTLDFAWYDEDSYVANGQKDVNMYYPAQWEGLAWICSEDLPFLYESSITSTAASAQDSTKTVAEYMESKGWTHAYQYNTNGNVPLVVGSIPDRSDLSLTGTQTSPKEGDYSIGGSGQNYFSGVTFHVKNDMDFGGTGTDYFKDTTLVTLTSAATTAAGLNAYYSYMGGPNYYPVGSQCRNDGVYVCLNDSSNHFWGIFCGSIDGEGHLMDNIYCDRGDASNVGGALGGSNYYQSTGLVGRVGMPDGTDTKFAQNDSTIKNIAVDGFIYGERSIGGIIGKTLHLSTGHTIYVKSCVNFATIWSTQSKGSGGIVGASWNGPDIYDCVNFGRCINGYTNGCGGLSGSTEADFFRCYNVGMVSLRSGNPASFASQNGTSSVTDCYALVGSTFSGTPYYSTSSKPYLTYRLTGVNAIASLSDATGDDFLKNINAGGRTWTRVGTSATKVSSDVTLKSSSFEDALTTQTLFYGYDGTTKSTQTGVANLPIPRAFAEDSATVTSVTKTSDPTTTSYIETQTFSTKGMVITANYSDGTSEAIDDYTVNKTTGLETTDTSVTISGTYKGVSYSFDIPITVAADELTSLNVTKNPSNLAFAADEALDTTGMVVTATFTATGTAPKTLTSDQYTVTENRAENKITVSKTYNGKTLTADVPITFLSVNAPTANADGYIEIPSADVYKWFASKVNAGQNSLNGLITADFTISGDDYLAPGTQSVKYVGHLNGQNHTITMDTSAASSARPAFVGHVSTGAIIENVKLVGTIKNEQYYTAPVGYLWDGTVRNITSSCTIEGADYTGGIVGKMGKGSVENCLVTGGTVTGGKNTGGIVGSIEGGTITDCGNKATVGTTTAYKLYTGGIAGYVNTSSSSLSITISGCYNKGNVSNTANAAASNTGNAGCFGYVYAYYSPITITDCYNTGNVSANYIVGGVVGYARGNNSTNTVKFNNCYSTGTVTNYNGTANTTYSGSFAGYTDYSYVTFTNCYALSDAFSVVIGSSSNSDTQTGLASASKASADMLSLQSTLGTSYKAGTDINSPAYPALSWETATAACTHAKTTGGAVTSRNDGTHYTTAVVCSECGETLTPATDAVSCTYGSWDASTGTRTCTACGYSETCSHAATTGGVVTSKGDGTHNTTAKICSTCGMTVTSATEAVSCTYGSWDASTGTRTCTACGYEQTCSHAATTGGTATSNGDGTHNKTAKVCSTCGKTVSEAASAEACTDANYDGGCDVCGAGIPYNITVRVDYLDGTSEEQILNLNQLWIDGTTKEVMYYSGTNRKPDPRCIAVTTEYVTISDILAAAGYDDYAANCWTLTAYEGTSHTNALPLGTLLNTSRYYLPEWARADNEYSTALNTQGAIEVPAVLALKSYHTNIYNASDEYYECVNDQNAFAQKADYMKAPRLLFGQDTNAAADDTDSLNYGNLGFNSYSNVDTLVITEVEHDEVEVSRVAATCTKDGTTAGARCSVCGKIISGCRTIPASHTVVEDPAVAATCTTEGKTAGSHCSVCGEVIVAQETIAAGHTFAENGFCSVCGAYNPDAADNGETPAYLVTTAAQLREIARAVNAGDNLSGKTVKLGSDIAVAADGKYAKVEDVVYGTASYECIADQYYITADASDIWTPIGQATATSNTALTSGYTPFAGTFDGCGHTVSGIYTGSLTAAANTATVQGLFGVVTGTVKNVTVSGCVTAKMVAAGVVAYLNGGKIENCTNNAIVFVDGGTTPNGGTENGTKRVGAVGGIAGNAMTGSAISGCTNTADIICVNTCKGGRAGGILGLIDGNYAVTIDNCQNSGSVVAYQYSGGIVGGSWSSSAPITGCKNTGKIRATSGGSAYVGGITAYSCSNITNCYNTGEYGITINGTFGDKCAHMGGIVSDLSGAYVINCYNTGTNFYSAASATSATRSSYGGICGTGYGTSSASKITNCYTTVNEGEDLEAGVVTLASSVSAADLGSGFVDSCPNAVLTWETPVAHTAVEDAAVAPTCTTEGKTAGSHCSVCNAVIKAQEKVEATGHNYGAWTQSGDTYTRICTNEGCSASEKFGVDFRGAEGESLANVTVDGENIKFAVDSLGTNEIVYANGEVLSAVDGIYTVSLAAAKADGIATRLIGDADGNGKVTSNDAGMMLLAATNAVTLSGANGAAANAVNGAGYSERALRVLSWMAGMVDALA